MNRKIIQTLTVLFILLLLMAPVFGAITEGEALTTAKEYSKSSESTAVYGPYKSENKSYYYAEYRTGDALTGVLVINMETGNVVSDEKTLREVLFTVCFLMNVNNASITASNQAAQKYRTAASQSTSNANLLNKIAETYEEIETVEKDVVVSLNTSYENAMKLSELFKELEESLKSLNTAYSNDLTNAGITKQDIEDAIEEIETMFQNNQARVDRGINFSNDRVESETKATTETKATPGFGLTAVIFSLAVIGLFLRKQKK